MTVPNSRLAGHPEITDTTRRGILAVIPRTGIRQIDKDGVIFQHGKMARHAVVYYQNSFAG